jgi:integrase
MALEVIETTNKLQAGSLEQARAYLDQAKAARTRRAYLSDWAHFAAWCGGQDREARPCSPATLVLYLTELAQTHKPSTLTRRLSAISQAHQAEGYHSPTQEAAVRSLMAGIRRTHGTAATTKKPLLLPDLAAMLDSLPDDLLGLRDRALLLTGFAGGFRRSELVALDWEDIEFGPEGLAVTIRRSKTDPEGQGRKIGIPYGQTHCPVRALEAWRDRAGGDQGPVFRGVNGHGNLLPGRLSDKAVARAVQRRAAAAGLNPEKYSGHSLRAGLATAAALGGASERSIMRQTGHRSLATVRRYIRNGSLFLENAAAKTGL